MSAFAKALRDSLTTRNLCVSLLLVTTIAVYWRVIDHDFLNYDDGPYILENRVVAEGLTMDGIGWAFTTGYQGNWHPLTWISHMIDVELFGMKPAGHHIVNVILHTFNTLLIIVVFWRMTHSFWPSFFLAAAFALHPLHVESVAWAAERKDVLSTLFWLLTMLAYVRYVERPGPGRYVAVLVLFTLGLMAKPMLVSLPLVFLILDYWPLERLKKDTLLPLLREKLPLMGIAIVSSIATYIAQSGGMSVADWNLLPLDIRLMNAAVSYVTYLWKTLWPTDLAVFYPHPGATLPVWKAIAASSILIVITLAVLWMRRLNRFLLVGWSWYLVTLIPVIGIVQVGAQAMADRYTYVPLLGIFLIAAWGIPALLPSRQWRVTALSVATVGVLAVWAGTTRHQLSYWQNTVTIFEHAIAVTPDNYIAHINLGKQLEFIEGRTDEALPHYFEALRVEPDNVIALNSIGTAMAKRGDVEKGQEYVERAVKVSPQHGPSHFNLGIILDNRGIFDRALTHFSIAAQLMPNDPRVLNNFGGLLLKQGRADEALPHLEKAVTIDPKYPSARYNLAYALGEVGRADEAIAQFKQVLRLNEKHIAAMYNIGLLYMNKEEWNEAARFFNYALDIKPDYWDAQRGMVRALELRDQAIKTQKQNTPAP